MDKKDYKDFQEKIKNGDVNSALELAARINDELASYWEKSSNDLLIAGHIPYYKYHFSLSWPFITRTKALDGCIKSYREAAESIASAANGLRTCSKIIRKQKIEKEKV